MNATFLLLGGLVAGADPVPPAAPVTTSPAPVVVSTGAGCVGCGNAVAAPVYHPHAAQPATLVDWVKSKQGSSQGGLFARLRAKTKNHAPAAAPLATPCCDSGPIVGAPVTPLPGTVVIPGATAPTTTTPSTGGTATPPKEMPKAKPEEPAKKPAETPKPADTPKGDAPKGPSAIAIPPLPVTPTAATRGAGTNSPY